MSPARLTASLAVSLTLLVPVALSAQNAVAVGSLGSAIAAASAVAIPAAALESEDDALETRHYELAGLGPDHRHDDLNFALLPFLDDLDRNAGAEGLELEELVYTLLQDVVAPDQFQYAGREINTLEGGRLEVTAPAAVHAEVQRLIDALSQGFRRRATLELSVERIGDGASAAKQLSERTVDELRSAGLLMPARKQTVELFVGQGHRLRSELRHQITRGWESEIANTAASVIPITQELRTGLDLLLRLEAEPDGSYRLRNVGRLGELVSNDSRWVSVEGDVMNESGTNGLFRSKKIDDTVVSWAALSGAARLAPGDSTHQLLWTRTQLGFAGWVVGMRLVDVQDAPLAVFGERAVTVVDLSTEMWPAQHEGKAYEHIAPTEDYLPRDLVWPSLASDADGRSWGHDNDLRLYTPVAAWDHSHGANTDAIYELGGDVWVESNWAVASGETQAVRGWLAQRAAAASPARSMILEVGVDSQERGNSSLQGPQVRAQLTLLEGDALIALVGDARRFVAEYETDVAQGATITRPELGDLFDGMLLSAESASGQVLLEVELGRLLSEIGSQGSPSMEVDAPEMLSARFSARLSPDGERKVLGEIAPGFGDGPRLQLWARLRQAASVD
ncbi:MAG: hypothetical protein DHS20C15_25990 [Planctomycetota bacterium]|nr:MAG: hypothetical protein DHS20C15_25990 [Planctomycetota bacterium]